MMLKASLQHYLDELHIYCRLRDVGLPKNVAKSLAVMIAPKRNVAFIRNHKETLSLFVIVTGLVFVGAEVELPANLSMLAINIIIAVTVLGIEVLLGRPRNKT